MIREVSLDRLFLQVEAVEAAVAVLIHAVEDTVVFAVVFFSDPSEDRTSVQIQTALRQFGRYRDAAFHRHCGDLPGIRAHLDVRCPVAAVLIIEEQVAAAVRTDQVHHPHIFVAALAGGDVAAVEAVAFCRPALRKKRSVKALRDLVAASVDCHGKTALAARSRSRGFAFLLDYDDRIPAENASVRSGQIAVDGVFSQLQVFISGDRDLDIRIRRRCADRDPGDLVTNGDAVFANVRREGRRQGSGADLQGTEDCLVRCRSAFSAAFGYCDRRASLVGDGGNLLILVIDLSRADLDF